MPYKIGSINAVNVLLFVPADSDWRANLRQALLGSISQDEATRVDGHMELLSRRWSGELDWTAELPSPAPRNYLAMLREGGPLPLYRYGPIRFTVDLHNPGNEAGDPAYDPSIVEIELLVHQHEIYPWDRGTMPDGTKVNYGDPEMYGRQSVCGEALEFTKAQRAKFDSFWGKGHPPHLAHSLHGRTARPVSVHLCRAPQQPVAGGHSAREAGGAKNHEPGVPPVMAISS